MSKQQGWEERVLAQLADVVRCCSPLARDLLSAEQAVEPARVFKAMGDPAAAAAVADRLARRRGGLRERPDRRARPDRPTISYHLKVLREAGLITGERRGTWVYHRVQPALLDRLCAVLVPGTDVSEPDHEAGHDVGGRW